MGLVMDFVKNWASRFRGGELALATPQRKFWWRYGLFVGGFVYIVYYYRGSLLVA